MLVKFTKFQYIDNLIKGRVKTSFSKKFNDPFDSRLILDDSSIQKLAGELKQTVEFVKFYIDMFHSAQIGCFIKCDPFKHKQSMLMWAHYANSAKDLAVCFDDQVLSGEASFYKDACFKVNYDKSTIDTSYEVIKKYIEAAQYKKSEMKDILISFFSQKSKVWEYEDEFRVLNLSILMASVPLIQHAGVDYVKAREVLKEAATELDGTCLSFLELGKPQKIIMGYDFANEDKLRELCGYHGIKLSRIGIPQNFTSYEFIEIPII